MPPVPSVSLAAPGTTQPWPRSDACWSPARPPIGGAPGRAVAGATTPAESTMAGSTWGGIRNASSTDSSQPDPSAARRPVTAALPGSVTWTAPPESVQASQVSTVPKASSPAADRLRSASARSRRKASLVAEALGARCSPCACSARHMPTVRRSCQPTPGPTGCPLRRSHRIVDARWLVMPTAATGPPQAARASWATASAASACSTGSNSTKLTIGEVGSAGRYLDVTTSPAALTTAARTPLVPTSTARTPGSPRPAGPVPPLTRRSRRRGRPAARRGSRPTSTGARRRPRSPPR